MKFFEPKKLDEALNLVKNHPDYKILAGGTDLCVLMNGGFIKPAGVINIWGLDELGGIGETDDFIEIGALSTHSEIIKNPLIEKYAPALARACSTIGARQIQNRGTIGGNVMNASPAGDAMPALLVYDAEVEAARVGENRWIRFADFYKGYRETALVKGEIVTRLRISKSYSGGRAAFLKIGTRKAQAISKVMGCFRLKLDGGQISDVAIAYGSVAPVPIRTPKTEIFLKGKTLTDDLVEKAIKSVTDEVTPIDDIRSTADYRRYICGVLLKRFLKGYL